jgi:hypothetical protein
VYAIKLEGMYGFGVLQELDALKKAGVKLTAQWYEDKITELTGLIRELEGG